MFYFYTTDTTCTNHHLCLTFDEVDTNPVCRPSFEEGDGCLADAPSRSLR